MSELPEATTRRSASPTGAIDSEARQRELLIKRRIIRPKRIRKPEEEDTLSSPGAGPSSPRRTQRSRTPDERPSFSSSSTEPGPAVTLRARSSSPPHAPAPAHRSRNIPPPACLYAPTRRNHPSLTSCRSVYNYTRLNHIEEGTYGVVFRAKCNETGEIYALKKLKLEEEKQGFPITSLREVMALMIGGRHENVVGIKEIVVGDTLNQWVDQASSFTSPISDK
jgi:cell division cycle 2-like protein